MFTNETTNDTSHDDEPEYEDVLPMSEPSEDEKYHCDESYLNVICVLVAPLESDE